MFDNGILKYYKNRANLKNGHLQVEKLGFVVDEKKHVSRSTLKILSPSNELMFLKIPLMYGETHAETLLSQIYKSKGIETAIYTPVAYKGSFDLNMTGLISNNVCISENFLRGSEIFRQIYKDTTVLNSDKLLFDKSQKYVDFTKYFTKDALRDFIRIQVFDLASNNTDRHTDNLFFRVENGKVAHVITIDQGSSMEDIMNPQRPFVNYFGGEDCEKRNAIIEKIKHNEIVSELVELKEIAEKVGSVNAGAVAKDIKEQTDFSIDENYISCISHSFDNTAEMLIK